MLQSSEPGRPRIDYMRDCFHHCSDGLSKSFRLCFDKSLYFFLQQSKGDRGDGLSLVSFDFMHESTSDMAVSPVLYPPPPFFFPPTLPSRKENPPLCWMLVWQRFTANKDTVGTKMIRAAMKTMEVCVGFKEEAGKVFNRRVKER